MMESQVSSMSATEYALGRGYAEATRYTMTECAEKMCEAEFPEDAD